MKISLNWLGDYLTWIEKDPQVIADRLTLSTAEVEEVETQGKFLEHCCVGEVLSIAKHPSADRLLLVDVKTDKGTKRVVCGGTNLKEGMYVAFAHIGATVKWHGGEVVTLEPVKIRGEKSEGMICAAEELGIEAIFPSLPEDGERPIVDLSRLWAMGYEKKPGAQSPELKAGDNLRDALHQTDTILHFSNTAITARPDLFSHIGFARECVALGLAKWKKAHDSKLTTQSPSKKDGGPSMHVDCPELIPRYLACTIAIDSLGETPSWMKKHLEAVGIRSINLPVDITNYVMMEIGVPLHSFDADDIKGAVHMRLSKKGEHLTTLDGEKRVLPTDCLVLSDDDGIFDLLGIMGGLRSSTKETTTKIFLHALSIDPPTIRRAIIGTGLRTDASTMYEKGVPPITTERGFYRALELFLELVPGAKVVSAIEDKGSNGKANAIKIPSDDIRKTLGIDIANKDIVKILEDLDCTVMSHESRDKKDTRNSKLETRDFVVTPPLHRLRDITGPHDIVEEVGRIHGFDSVPSVLPVAPLQLPSRDRRVHDIREGLRNAGFVETVPLSFVSPSLMQKCNLDPSTAVHVKNPIGEETSLLHTDTVPALLAHAETMLPRMSDNLGTFQIGNVFDAQGHERRMLGLLFCSKHETDLTNDPFLVLKADLLSALKRAGYTAEVTQESAQLPMAHPGRTAAILVNGQLIGACYEVHPLIRSAFDLPHRAAAASIDLTALLKFPVAPVQLQPLSTFPAISYDVTVKRTVSDHLGPLMKKLRTGSSLLEDVSVHDLYAGKPLSNGEYNLTLRFVYRAADRTLTEEEAKKEHEKVVSVL
jgi:phenylalanyl-tRNA synthetase beta chain